MAFFGKLYCEVPETLKELPSNMFPHLSGHDIKLLGQPIIDGEIRRALFNMAPLKASGSDGFHAHFFQSQWDIVGIAVCEWVSSVFFGNDIDVDLNNTLIVLIPKKDSPEDFSQFRLINFCSVMYKLVMKVVANQFKLVFSNLIS